tara:strand:+ start:610 stop:1338 length:729 start_codon:yes stop_codon:yes gene_type:complete
MSLVFSYNYSPNFSTYRRISKSIKFIVIHYTGMSSQSKAIKRLIDEDSKVSCHFFIKKNGEVILMVPEKYTAWHAGISNWGKYSSLNKNSIGIEIHNTGHDNKYESFNKKQINSLIKLCLYLKKKYKIKNKNIVGHSDISYSRKKDPGEKFPWNNLAQKKLSVWHNLNDKTLRKLRKISIHKKNKNLFFINLKKFGYYVQNDIKKKNKNYLIKAFQRRFRNQLIDGKIDKECYEISKKLSIL